jgi:hypothetical protein
MLETLIELVIIADPTHAFPSKIPISSPISKPASPSSADVTNMFMAR